MNSCFHALLKTAICILIIAMLAPFCKAQNSFEISVKVGVGSGWWLYNKGSVSGEPDGNIGFGRSHASLFSMYGLTPTYHVKRLNIGLVFNLQQLWDKNMVGSRHRRSYRELYPISNGVLNIYQYGGTIGYDIIHKSDFTWTPQIEFGSFYMQTNFYDKARFNSLMFLNIGFSHLWKTSSNWAISFYPLYSHGTIHTKSNEAKGEKHEIHSLLLNIGIHYQFSSKRFN